MEVDLCGVFFVAAVFWSLAAVTEGAAKGERFVVVVLGAAAFEVAG